MTIAIQGRLLPVKEPVFTLPCGRKRLYFHQESVLAVVHPYQLKERENENT
jgi:hypothetical protein